MTGEASRAESGFQQPAAAQVAGAGQVKEAIDARVFHGESSTLFQAVMNGPRAWRAMTARVSQFRTSYHAPSPPARRPEGTRPVEPGEGEHVRSQEDALDIS